MRTGDQKSRVEALARGMAGICAEVEKARAFDGRVSARAAKAFMDAGIDAPERLLFMSKAEVAALPGVGPAAVKEALAYQARFQRA